MPAGLDSFVSPEFKLIANLSKVLTVTCYKSEKLPELIILFSV